MPVWAQIILGTAAVVTAIGVLWTKGIRPLVKGAVAAERTLPVLMALTDTFHGDPNVFKVLQEIAAQFRTDSGSTLRDVVNRLEAIAESSQKAIEELTAEVEQRRSASTTAYEASRMLAAEDRQQIARLVIALKSIDSKQDAAAIAAAVVATDLEAGHLRAEAIDTGASGDAADAAATRPVGESEPS